MSTNTLNWKTAVALLAAPIFAACGDSTGVDGPQNVSLSFRVAGSAAPAMAAGLGGAPSRVVGDPLTLRGSNGILTISEIRLIVAEVELKHADGSCDDSESTSDSCPEFEAPPRFLDLPLDGSPISAITALIEPGTYKELEFEIEDLEDDEDDPTFAAAITLLRQQIEAVVDDWPRRASVMVSGSFQPTDDDVAQDFRVFIEAEIEIEMELVPNLVVAADGSASRDLVVDVRPDIWFMDGPSVLDLTTWDYVATGLVLELEVEMEDGFVEIEIDG